MNFHLYLYLYFCIIVFCLDIFLCSSPNEALVQSNVSLPNSRIPPVSRSRLNLSLCFPLHPVLNVLAADCLNSDLDLCGRLSRLRQAVMKAIRRGVFQSMRPRLTKPRLSGSYQPPVPSLLMSFVFPVFSESWVDTADTVNSCVWGAGTLLAGPAPCPLHLPYLRHCPAPLLRVPSRIHCTITPQIYPDMPLRMRKVIRLIPSEIYISQS